MCCEVYIFFFFAFEFNGPRKFCDTINMNEGCKDKAIFSTIKVSFMF